MLEERATNHSAQHTGLYVSDIYLTSGWYDVGSRNMPTDPSKLNVYNSCGTYYPIWMIGTIPQTSEGKVTRTACIFTDWSECSYTIEIEVINCGTHMLYNLSTPNEYEYYYYYYYHSYYYTAYCFGKYF
ncbi:hypothetical protein CHS0354_031678 [Potamilus streckersoni]|uniref:Uncharacterized protein n=1 Tax=Potamilus streckersoni TaxID=2493646 RepID=A0AAE0SRM8_9BIVA|nr:hypothetical protein CHS0354_031678 [Potamilus streckersoni]